MSPDPIDTDTTLFITVYAHVGLTCMTSFSTFLHVRSYFSKNVNEDKASLFLENALVVLVDVLSADR